MSATNAEKRSFARAATLKVDRAFDSVHAGGVDVGLLLVVLLALTLANAFFSGSEIALLSVRKTRLQELASEGLRGARAALRLRETPERFLATIQVGITVIGATAGAFGGAKLEAPVEAGLRQLGFDDWAPQVALALVVVLISFMSIVIGELVPKSLALRYSERASAYAAPIISVLATSTRPIVWFLTTVSNLLLKPFGDETNFSETRLSAEELRQLLEEAAAAGSVNEEAGAMASAAMDLASLRVLNVMVPRQDAVTIPEDASRQELLVLLKRVPYSRFPVIAADAETVTGYVIARELALSLSDSKTLDLPALLRPVLYVPEFSSALSAFRTMQQNRQPLAVVVDEHGVFSGVVTLEDILEEVAGDILDEHDIPKKQARREDGGVVALGTAPVRQLNREFGLQLPEGPKFSTIAGLVLQRVGRMPQPGETLQLDNGYRIQITETSPRRITKLRIIPSREHEVE